MEPLHNSITKVPLKINNKYIKQKNTLESEIHRLEEEQEVSQRLHQPRF